MAVAQTLHEIALDKAKKRPELVDFLTEEAPILKMLKWIPATHGLWNVEEVLDSIQGASFTDLGAPLPSMKAETQLRQTYVNLLGGEVEVSKDKADQFGGAAKYFARRENAFYKQAGMDTELAIWRDYWRKAALKHKLVTKCGATANAYTILIVRFDQENNVGIYDPAQFNQGRLLNPERISGGSLYHLRSQPGVSGYGVEYRGRFGWQLLNAERAVFGLVNVDAEHLPTLSQIEDAIAAVRGTATNTYIFGHHKIVQKTFSAIKQADIMYVNGDKDLQTIIGAINGIKIIGSYNLPDGTENAVA
ncbi:major capsid protein [Bilophila sp.]|uniref:major capsid protein n=1 Tax=Bilophila sp. TaxID=1929485 RepID=UPI0030784FD4